MERNHGFSGRFPGTVNVNIGPVLGTMVIFFLSLVASLGKYAFRIQNAYQLIDCSKENGVAVVYTSGHGGG